MEEKTPVDATVHVSDIEDGDMSDIQEGGARAWLTVVGSALVYFASFGFMNSFGYFQDFYQTDYLYEYSSSTISFIGTLQISLMYIVGPVAGALFDSYGLKVEPYMVAHHPSTTIHSYLLPLINGSSFFGRIIGGLLADKFGRLNLLYPMTLLSGVFCLAMWLPAINVASVVAFVCLYGFTSGIFISVTPAVVAQISPEDRIGARIGAFFTLAAIATLTGTPIAGALVGKSVQDGYNNVIVFAEKSHLSFGSPKPDVVTCPGRPFTMKPYRGRLVALVQLYAFDLNLVEALSLKYHLAAQARVEAQLAQLADETYRVQPLMALHSPELHRVIKAGVVATKPKEEDF
ncbi:uncharacterized protein N0V89_003503 [Didymosphaeria variabile]|uniref:MFS general substrate transporter n=1 Tax=Didymosphaeria variabile TaxID=1932322 RepID=A0A9W8XNV5_9PLEO|nr:uncharacterized protein N0V89_003503 [Didymosphaeria variabile]KAJ4355487.1 hypothetical protein N0V89_003503 [Didymosphaeria variabile]